MGKKDVIVSADAYPVMNSLPEFLTGVLSGIDALRKLQEDNFKETNESFKGINESFKGINEVVKSLVNSQYEMQSKIDSIDKRMDIMEKDNEEEKKRNRERERVLGKDAERLHRMLQNKAWSYYYFPSRDETILMTREQKEVYQQKRRVTVFRATNFIKAQGHYSGKGGVDTLEKDKELAELDIVNYRVSELEAKKIDAEYEEKFKAASGK